MSSKLTLVSFSFFPCSRLRTFWLKLRTLETTVDNTVVVPIESGNELRGIECVQLRLLLEEDQVSRRHHVRPLSLPFLPFLDPSLTSSFLSSPSTAAALVRNESVNNRIAAVRKSAQAQPPNGSTQAIVGVSAAS